MNERDRFAASLLFGKPDKVHFYPGGPRESTLKRWHSEGLPENTNWLEVLYEKIGMTPERTTGAQVPLPDLFGMMPHFEEKVLEHKDGHYIVQDIHGAVVEISDEFDVTYLRSAKDFVTRSWLKVPVENRRDWEDMRKRYDPAQTERYPADIERDAAILKNRDYLLGIGIPGIFWKLRDWCGFENLCIMMAEDPDFVAEMADFWKNFVLRVLGGYRDKIVFDNVIINEDMAYKEKAMISPAMTRRFLMPAWTAWSGLLKDSGCRVVTLDSDGYIGELIPLWIEAGINVCMPIEVAAGNDLVAYRKKYGRNMAYWCGIDKRAIARGGKIMEAELYRLIPPLLKEGGYIPGCDHAVPPDISWPDFIEYCRLLAKLTGWL